MRYVLAFLTAAVVATTLVAGAAAGEAGGQPSLRLTGKASIDRYLASIGVEPRTVVMQRGARNYAGPRCPGKGWSCTNASRVVQISSHHGRNAFECSPPGTGTNPAMNTCVIVQTATAGTNVATCRMRDEGTTVAQSCSITQTNMEGSNRATVELFARTRDGSTQGARQTVTVRQTNGSGRNVLHSLQSIDGVVRSFDPAQAQEGHQTLAVNQTSSSGKNQALVAQFQALLAKASAHRNGIVQRQNAVDGGPNLVADVVQTATNGRNSSLLRQQALYEAQAKSKAGPVEQRQGSAAGGLKGTVDQTSTAPSTSRNFQREDLNMRARTKGTLTQVQFGPAECCTEQLGNANNVFDIRQQSVLSSNGGAQSSRISGSCITSGTCRVDQRQRTDDDFETNSDSCTGSVAFPCSVFIGIVCVPDEGCFDADESEPSVVERGRGRGRSKRH
jgi:hypothetical protein